MGAVVTPDRIYVIQGSGTVFFFFFFFFFFFSPSVPAQTGGDDLDVLLYFRLMHLAPLAVAEPQTFASRRGLPMVYRDLSIFTDAHPELARAVCRYLGVPLGKAEVFEFSNENIFVKINQNVREHDVFVIQPTYPNMSDSILELLIMLDALKRARPAGSRRSSRTSRTAARTRRTSRACRSPRG